MIAMLAATFFLFQNEDIIVNEKFRVEYVTLDVLATRKGEIVTDLTKDDFEVKENGDRVEITLFDVLDLRNPDVDLSRFVDSEGQVKEIEIAADAPTPVQPPVPQVILALDLQSAGPMNDKRAFEQIREFLITMGDQQVLLNIYSLEEGAITKGWVINTDQALADFDAYVGGYFNRKFGDRGEGSLQGEGGRNSFGTQVDRSLLAFGTNELDELERAFSQCLRLYGPSIAPKCIRDTLNSYMDEHELRALRVINQIESLTYSFQQRVGLKMIYFVSPGFSVRAPRSPQDLARIYLAKAEGASGDRRNFSSGLPGFGYSLEDEYDRIVHACIRNRIIFHTIDIFNTGFASTRVMSAENGSRIGGEVERIFRQYETDVDMGLISLAEDSGGTFHQVNELAKLVQENMKLNRFFYVIGYDSPSKKPGKFRRIKVKVDRRGVKVYHRKGYIGAG